MKRIRFVHVTFAALVAALAVPAAGVSKGSAVPSSVGKGEYVQRTLLTVDDYGVVIPRYIDQSVDLLHTAQRLSDECHDRFGVRYFVPMLDEGGQGS